MNEIIIPRVYLNMTISQGLYNYIKGSDSSIITNPESEIAKVHEID